jgi:PKD repeat protein
LQISDIFTLVKKSALTRIPLLALLFVPLLALAQVPPLLLKSGVIVPEARVDWPPAEAAFEGYHFRMLQFTSLPDAATKQQLADAGVQLMDYLPHNVYYAAISHDSKLDWTSVKNLRAVLSIPEHWKMDPELVTASEISISYPRVLRADNVIRELVLRGGSILHRNDFAQVVGLRIPAEKLEQIAALPYISFVEALPPPPQDERQHFRSGSRSNYLADKHGLDGSGLVLAVAEGRITPSLIDLHNRLDVSYHPDNTNSGHARNVSQIMAGAGNENPVLQGMARGADVISFPYSIWGNAPTLYASPGLRISNQSWGAGCNTGYNNDARAVDITARNLPHFMMVFSTGNSQGSDCGYGAGTGWGTITGGVKTGKNVMSVGALNRYDVVTGFSSFGPATDGRIKPDISTTGEGGTSYASPTIAGMFAQLHQAFMQQHGGTEPPAGLIKAILQNTADDVGQPGPDFKHGYGKANGRQAYRVISEGTWQEDSVTNAQQRLLSFNVPAGSRALKVMVYWTDFEGAANAAKALVNDLDMELIAPGGTTSLLPWVLDPTPNSTTLNLPAVRGVDTLNNMEQVTLQNPAAGTWQVRVSGTEVPMGPQTFYVVTQSYQDELVLTYPLGGEGFVPGEREVLRWDATGAGTFDLDYSIDGGQSWLSMATGIADTLRHYEWTIPNMLRGNVRVRVRSGTMADSSANFTIAALPQNVSILWACSDSVKLTWDSVASASGYRITALGALYMDSIETVNGNINEVVLHNQSTTNTLWFAVQTLGANGALSRRTIAIRKDPGDFNCVRLNAATDAIVSHPSGFMPDCMAGFMAPLTVRIKNAGVDLLSNVDVSYRVNGGPISSGTISQSIPSGGTFDYQFSGILNIAVPDTYRIQVWTDMLGDPDQTNDTLDVTIVVYASSLISPQYEQNFDTLTNCSTAWGCSDIDCPLGAGWFNVPNVLGDSIDFRVNDGGTGTGNTGPSNDHTQGNNSGKYIYLETSGNGGSGCRGNLAYLHSPCIDLANTNRPMLSFWRHMYGSSIGELHIDVLSNGQWVEDVIPATVGPQGNAWLQDSVDLSAFVGETIVVRFRATTGNGFTGDLALDDIQLSTLPSADFASDRQLVCPNDVVTFSDSSFYVSNRQWTFSPNTVQFSGGTSATSQNPEVSFTQPGLYTVSLINTNTVGSDSVVKTAYINAGPHPLTLSTNDADNILCYGDSLILTAQSPAQTITFKEAGATLQSGSGTSLLVPGLTRSTSFTAVGTLYPGCFTDEPSVSVTVNDPQVSISPADSAGACQGDSVMLSADPGFASYRWTDGQSTESIVVRSPGSYAVAIEDSIGCEASSDSVVVDFFALPPLPTVNGPATSIRLETDTFIVNGQAGSSYQWSSLPNVTLTANGDTAFASWQAASLYTLWVLETSADGCTGDTLFFQVEVGEAVSIGPGAGDLSYSLYPNPAQQELFLDFSSRPAGEVSLTLFDLKGRKVLEQRVSEASNRMGLEGLAEGMYVLEIRAGRAVVWEKVWVR